MSDKRLQRWLRRSGWPAAVIAAFLLGTWSVDTDVSTADPQASEHAHKQRDGLSESTQRWTCSMHPQIQSEHPGTCPICGMDLVPHDGASDLQRVSLSKAAKARARIRTVEVQRQRQLSKPLDLLGRLEAPETNLRTVTAWISGRIDRLHVDTTGTRVNKGQVVATLYSPEVYAANRDLALAAEQVRALSGASVEAQRAAQEAFSSARRRLELLGISSQAIDGVIAGDAVKKHVAVTTPFAGTIVERLVSEGQYVQTGAGLYRLVDLSTLWVQLDAYQTDLVHVRVGQEVRLHINATGPELWGKVVFVDPVVDAARRTSRVRVEVPNPRGHLKPGMFARAVVMPSAEAEDRAPLLVPATAPLFTGKRAVVYVELPEADEPTYEPREVVLGPRLADGYPVVSGLMEGERVVIQGTFTLDADLQIRGGASMMTREGDAPPPGIVAPDAWASMDAAALSPDDRARLRPVLQHYLLAQRALAGDDFTSAAGAAANLEKAVGDVELHNPMARHPWDALRAALLEHSGALKTAPNIQDARRHFEELSMDVLALLRQLGNPTERALNIAACPMAIDNRHAMWVQEAEQVDNSYQGLAMRSCGVVESQVPPGARFLPEGSSTYRRTTSQGRATFEAGHGH